MNAIEPQMTLFSEESEFNLESAKRNRINQTIRASSKNKNGRGKPRKEVLGKKFGKLTIFDTVEDDSTPYQVWRAMCDCGCEILVTASTLRTLTHCGCEGWGRVKSRPGALGYKGEHGKKLKGKRPSKKTAFSRLFSRYQSQAKKRGIEWHLSKNQFKLLVDSPCHYCGVAPNQIVKQGDVSYAYNGIDRKESSEGYTESNTVSCCGRCNSAKMDTPYREFLEWIESISKHLGI